MSRPLTASKPSLRYVFANPCPQRRRSTQMHSNPSCGPAKVLCKLPETCITSTRSLKSKRQSSARATTSLVLSSPSPFVEFDVRPSHRSLSCVASILSHFTLLQSLRTLASPRIKPHGHRWALALPISFSHSPHSGLLTPLASGHCSYSLSRTRRGLS